MTGSYGHVHQEAGGIKGGTFRDELSGNQLLQKGCTPWSSEESNISASLTLRHSFVPVVCDRPTATTRLQFVMPSRCLTAEWRVSWQLRDEHCCWPVVCNRAREPSGGQCDLQSRAEYSEHEFDPLAWPVTGNVSAHRPFLGISKFRNTRVQHNSIQFDCLL